MLRVRPARLLLLCGVLCGVLPGVLCGVLRGAADGADGPALGVRVRGDVAFSLQLSEAARARVAAAEAPPGGVGGVGGDGGARARAAAATPAELACPHRYPEPEQVDAILSNMMNELTKVFVRANIFLKSEYNSRQEGLLRAKEEGEGKEPAPAPASAAGDSGTVAGVPASAARDPGTTAGVPTSAARDPGTTAGVPATAQGPDAGTGRADRDKRSDSRFKVVNGKKTEFFEHIFHNMTEEFSGVYNGSQAYVWRARAGRCAGAGEVRRAWGAVLRRALASFRRAALHCVQDYLRIQECDARTRGRLVQYLVRELAKMRRRQLQLLCDRFQLCYDGLV